MVNVLRAITTSSSPVKVSITLTKGKVALFMFLSQKITRSPTVNFFQSVVHCCLPVSVRRYFRTHFTQNKLVRAGILFQSDVYFLITN